MIREVYDLIECRGWKNICPFLGVKDKATAKKILKRHGLLAYEHGRPILNCEAWRIASFERHTEE